MELNSPRKDPYSSMARAENQLEKEGYRQELTVIDENTVQSKDGARYKPGDLVLYQIIRDNKSEVYHRDAHKESRPKALFALQGPDNMRGLIKETMDTEESKIVEGFLQQVDRHDDLQENYSA